MAGLAAVEREKRLNAALKPSRLQTVLKYAGLVSSLWLAWRAQGSNRK